MEDNHHVNWTADQCRSEVNTWSKRYHRFYLQIQKIIPLLQSPPIIVRYESLQTDPTGVLQSLVRHLVTRSTQQAVQTSTSEWSKRTPENLRRVLTHFNDIHASFSHASCEIFRQQLEADSARVFDPMDSLLLLQKIIIKESNTSTTRPYLCEAVSDISSIRAMFQQSIIL